MCKLPPGVLIPARPAWQAAAARTALLVPATPAMLPVRPKGLPEKQLPGDAEVLSGKSVRYTGAPLCDAP